MSSAAGYLGKIGRLLPGRRNRAAAARRRADAARGERRWPQAASGYRAYLDHRPEDAAIWIQLGHALKESGQLAEAGAAYAKALELAPRDADAHLQHGHLLKLRGDMHGAARSYGASAEIDGNADARRELGAPELLIHLRDAPAPDTASDPGLVEIHKARRGIGVIDMVNGAEISGWAVDPDESGHAAEIEFRSGDKVVGRAVSHLFRPDVAMHGYGTTNAGFEATLALDRGSKDILRIHAYLRRTGEELEKSPFETTGFIPYGQGTTGSAVTAARVAVAKRFERPPGAETALFVTHSPDGVLKPHVLPYLQALRDGGIHTLLIVVPERPMRLSAGQLDAVAGAIVRENVGYDFAAWAHAIRLYPEVYNSAILYLINDSMFGPNSQAAFDEMLVRLRASPADLVGLTENHESGWHVQSYFMALKRSLLQAIPIQQFFNSIMNLSGKQAVIDAYELRLAPLVEANGFRATSLFATNDPRNATMFAWRELIEAGMPFVKTLLFREKSFLFDISNWATDLAGYGFDVPLLKDTLKHHGVTGAVPPDFPLLVMPADRSRPADAPLKVAVYGPWNYDNGLGAAGRGIIAAIRTTGARLNLHPVKKTFYIHRPLVPAYDIRDFEGPADIAIVHLNPDSWGALTKDQRHDIAAAGKRIGYWVWEMAHLPDGWRAEFDSVDRIWAPSGYCAEVFAAQNGPPVDVVPHAVPLAEDALFATDRKALLAELGIPANRRIILYVFDGSSYLVRKNPHALVRSFAASGLGQRGWTLVLKTKHLMDRPADGRAFEAMVDATPDAVLINRALSQNQLNDLFAAADIYASPHCSEGFGLTIAEAMAAGKAVVATDFSGSTEFLDASCGYPVPAARYRLEEGFGHYTEGGEWARIDETALAATLKRAANDIERGDRTIPDAARRRIADRLSATSVGERIRASFAATLDEGTPRWPMPASLASALAAGSPLATADLGEKVTAYVLGEDLAPNGNALDRIGASSDRWLLLAPAGARVSPDFRSAFLAYTSARPDVAIFYGDDVAIEERDLFHQLRLKPEFDITLFAAQDYIGAPLLVCGSALHQLGGLATGHGPAALTDLIVRAWARGLSIARIPEVLLGYPGRRPRVPAGARRAVLAAERALQAYEVRPGLTPETLQLGRRFDASRLPSVTIVVPTRGSATPDGTVYVARMLDSLGQTDWPMDRLHVLIGDDNPGAPDWASRKRPFAVRRVETPRAPGQPFNYAAKMNRLWREAATDLIVMMNDDVVATDPSWLKALMTFAMSEDVGAVGPLLLYENGTIQHAGVVGGLFGLCAHGWLYRRSTAGSYQDWVLTHREWSMITGAVMATRTAMMERVGGFDERFALEFNDIDLCLRMRAIGARIVYTPHARMIHAEKASRGATPPPAEDLALFLRRWRGWLDNDPAFHPKMQHHRLDLEPGYDAGDWFVR